MGSSVDRRQPRTTRRLASTLAALVIAAGATVGLGAGRAAAHNDAACGAYAHRPSVSGDEISSFGWGSCEDSRGHYQHQMLCARTSLQKRRSNGSYAYVSDPTPHTCRYDASHVGDSSWEVDDYCADGDATRFAGVFRTRVYVWARNEAGQLVHEKWGYSDPRSIRC